MKKFLQKLSVLIGSAVICLSGNLTAFAAEASAEDQQISTGGAILSTFILPMVVLIFLYLLMIRPQQKQERETREMQESLQVGDEVITRGGIVGLVLRVDDNTKTVLLETGSNHVKIRVIQEAIARNMTAEESAAKEQKNKPNNPISPGKPKDE